MNLPTFFFCLGVLCFVISIIINLVIIRNDISAIRRYLEPPIDGLTFGADFGTGKDKVVVSSYLNRGVPK
jgi:hypothetical protein